MPFSLCLDKPTIIQARKHFIDCNEYLICSFIAAYKLPFHWLFSNNWGFYYYSVENFSAKSNACRPILTSNLEALYTVKKTEYQNYELLDIIQDVVSRNMCLFTFGEAWHIPWHIYAYQKQIAPHFFLITDYNKETHQVYVIDWVPEYSGWISFDQVNKAYKERRGYCFELSTPTFDMSSTLLMEQLRPCFRKIMGESNSEYRSGLFGLKEFRDDLQYLDKITFELLDTWWDPLKAIIDIRDKFLEFFYYLGINPDPSIEKSQVSQMIVILEKVLSAWMTFRNGLMKSKMTGEIDILRGVGRLEKIIELEQQCALQLEKTIS